MDIVDRLRSGEDGLEYAAADEIERLRAEIERLREALEGLLDVQNGAPLLRNQSEYDMAVEAARVALKGGKDE